MLDMGFDPPGQGGLSLHLAGLTELQASYMPYLRQGGIFIATGRRYHLGEPVAARVTLAGEAEPMQVQGEVAWISPAGAQGNRAAGIGIHFSKDGAVQQVRQRIEILLAQHGQSAVASYTM